MAKVKKAFDREEMYKKIMPTASRTEKEEVVEEFGENTEQEIHEINTGNNTEKISAQDSSTLFTNKEIKWIKDSADEAILYNITERLVINRLEVALKKMNCCRCDRCKKDIIALAMNSLQTHYVVGTKDEIDKIAIKDEILGLEITSAILKAILNVRKNPRH